MFPTSTQKKNWTFADESELQKLREEANKKYVEAYGKELEESKRADLLTASEERIVLHKYELQLREFCRKFVPPMPRAVTGTAFHYFKRFYLNNSVMNYHPKEILVTCVYLACKVEEFNLSMKQFVSNIKGDRDKAADIILNTEFLVLRQLRYQLLIHNPYRPVEGFIIDIKTRGNLQNVDRLRPGIEDFLDKLFLTDAILLYSPSQLALAGVIQAASKLQENLDSYVTDVLLGPDHQAELANLIEAIRKIRSTVRSADIKFLEPPQREVIKQLEKRIENCRNQNNNPDSEVPELTNASEQERYAPDWPYGVGISKEKSNKVMQVLSSSSDHGYKQRMKRELEDEDDYVLQMQPKTKEQKTGDEPLSGLSSFSSSST